MTQRHPDPGQQLGHAERLGQVVVGPGIESVHLVVLAAPGGQDDDRHLRPLAHPGDDLHAVHVGKTEIEDDEIGHPGQHVGQSHPPRLGLDHFVPVVGEGRLQEAPDGTVVLDDEDARRGGVLLVAHVCAPSCSIALEIGRRLPEREEEAERRSAAGAVLCPDPSAVGADDGPGYRQTQPGSSLARGGRGGAAEQLLKDAFLFALCQPGSPVAHADHHSLLLHPCADVEGRAGGAVLESVLQEVDQDLLDEHAVQGHERQVGGKILVDHSAGQFLAQPSERRADDVLEREPLLLDFDRPGVEPGHAEQVVDQPGQTVGLLDHFLQQRGPLGLRPPTRPVREERCWPRRSPPAGCADRATPS